MKKILVANWKMHKTRKEAISFLSGLELSEKVDFRIAAPFTLIQDMRSHPIARKVKIGAQNMSAYRDGAYTGEISADMLLDVGAEFVILGHSERRHVFKETDQEIAAKVDRAVSEGIPFILCVGETLDERKAKKQHEVIQRQIQIAFEGLLEKHVKEALISYEPVWAIGTGKAATKEEAEDVHLMIKQFVGDLFSEEAGKAIRVLYGGSVTLKNLDDFLSQPHIDGALVGGAALNTEIVNTMIQHLEDESL